MIIKKYEQYIVENLQEPEWYLSGKNEILSRSLKISEMLKKDCASFIEEMSKYNKFIYRGAKDVISEFKLKEVRRNRTPRNTPSELSDFMDSLFYEKFGKSLRSMTVFATGRESNASTYGTSYLFFPIGKYDAYWNGDVFDLYADIEDYQYELTEDELDMKMIEFANGYKKNNIKQALNSEVEIMYDCETYYLINKTYESELMNILFN